MTALVDLSFALVAALSLMTVVWVASVAKKDASIVDAFWGLGFVLLAWVYFARADSTAPRGLLVPVLVTAWGVRLSMHIFLRNRGHGEDYRYREMRDRYGRRFAWISLGTVFWLQAVILWVVSLPLHSVQKSGSPAGWTSLDLLGSLLFLTGFTFETVGDYQLSRFRSDPDNRGKVLDRGLWRYTRHPNYFGDALVWWGLWVFALSTPGSWWTFVSPALMTFLLMRVSGVALLEKKLASTRPAYRRYVERTSAFFPWLPRD